MWLWKNTPGLFCKRKLPKYSKNTTFLYFFCVGYLLNGTILRKIPKKHFYRVLLILGKHLFNLMKKVNFKEIKNKSFSELKFLIFNAKFRSKLLYLNHQFIVLYL